MPVLESNLDAVTLYQQGARITRVVVLEVPGGNAPPDLEVAQLPLSLLDATARVRVAAVEGAGSVVATNVRVGLWVPPRDASVLGPPQQEILNARREMERVSDTIQQLEWEVGLLGGLPVPARPEAKEGEPPPPSPMNARLALDAFGQDGIAARRAQLAAHRAALRTLEEKLDALEEAQSRASTARAVTAGELRKSIHVRLQQTGGAVTRLTLEVQYLVPGARWAPSYQCRMSRDCRSAQLVMRALICQASGEDWRGVKVHLSTATPMAWTEIPQLNALRIGRAQPPPPAKAGFRPPPVGSQTLWADYDRDRSVLFGALPPATAYTLPQLGHVQNFGGLPAASGPSGGAAAPKKMARMRQQMRRESTPVSGAEYDEAKADDMEMAADFDGAAMEEPAPAPPPPPPMRAMAAPSPKGAMMEKRAAAKPAPGRGGGGPSGATLEAVVFTRLRLGGPQDAVRGKLTAEDARAFYLECLVRLAVTVDFDVMDVVARAEQRARAVANIPLPGGTVDVSQASGSFDFVYETEHPVDVASDGAFHSVAVGSRDGTSEVVYVVVPREDSNVYRQAWVKNVLAAPMLAGPAEVYVAGEYVLSTTLPTVAPRGDFKLGLGVEQSIRCARNTKYREARSGTKIVATHELIHELVIDLHNNLEREVVCEVRERIPVPAPNAEVVVEEGDVQPAWEVYDQQERGTPLEGGRQWRVNLPPNSTKQLKAQYVVKLYAQNELSGGNRREA
jgi:hypothetical protein